ncbi:hypothetical protein ACQPYA_17840 [Micromonospora sp. CA-263727]|uniref:hypothetical protein n=1 Tax=Micromonospora sp. CA-263727 TaxID=3239967 RepID=UPI003D8B801E
MAEGMILRVVSDGPVTDEELAEQARHLKDHLNQLPGVEATEMAAEAEPGTRDRVNFIFGVLALSVFAVPTVRRAAADIRHLAEVIKRYQERNTDTRLRMTLPDHTEIDVQDVSEQTLTEAITSASATQRGTPTRPPKNDGE